MKLLQNRFQYPIKIYTTSSRTQAKLLLNSPESDGVYLNQVPFKFNSQFIYLITPFSRFTSIKLFSIAVLTKVSCQRSSNHLPHFRHIIWRKSHLQKYKKHSHWSCFLRRLNFPLFLFLLLPCFKWDCRYCQPVPRHSPHFTASAICKINMIFITIHTSMMKHVLIDISNILIIIIAFHEIADAVSLSQGRAHITICEITS